MRVKRGIVGNRKKRALRKATKGFVGGRRKLMRATIETLHKAMTYSYRDRRQKKREFRDSGLPVLMLQQTGGKELLQIHSSS
jgi:large subunit ribosomal protein L20